MEKLVLGVSFFSMPEMSHKLRLYDSREFLPFVGNEIDGALAVKWQREGGKRSIMCIWWVGWLMLRRRGRFDKNEQAQSFKHLKFAKVYRDSDEIDGVYVGDWKSEEGEGLGRDFHASNFISK